MTIEARVETTPVMYIPVGLFCDNANAHPKTVSVELGRLTAPINLKENIIVFGSAHDFFDDLETEHIESNSGCKGKTSYVFLKSGYPAQPTLQTL